MGLSVCPIAIVAAPVELVWANLVQWERYYEWADVRVVRLDPDGPATVGQTIVFGPKAIGRILHFTFKVEAVKPEKHQIAAHVFFPFGLQEKPTITCTPIDAASCRVQLHFPARLVGLVSRKIRLENNCCQRRGFLAAPEARL